MDDHPLIRFVDGPAGRRAHLLGTGKDIWEIVATLRDNLGDQATSAAYLNVPLGLVQAAATYYGAFTQEIDEWIQLNEQEAGDARAAWLAGNSAFRG